MPAATIALPLPVWIRPEQWALLKLIDRFDGACRREAPADTEQPLCSNKWE